jgi:hypothetical protein
VRVLKPRRDGDLALEPLRRDSGREIRREDLHDDRPPEGGLCRREHVRHPPATQLAVKSVSVAERRLEAVAEVSGQERGGTEVAPM